MRSTVLSLVVPALLSQAAPPQASQAYRETIPGTVVSFEMVPVPAGTVTIDGATVKVPAFEIGRTEVTWDLYDVFALGLDAKSGTGAADAVARPSQPYGAPDYGWGHSGYPAISIAKPAAQAFAAWLSTKTGKKYRLPTEAEWLRAAELSKFAPAQAGDVAWHAGNANGQTHPVASKKADALGLFDLFGNAAEWVTTEKDAVTRGGSFRDAADAIGPKGRAVADSSWNARDPQLPKSRWWLSDGPFVGFRLVREN
jgi:formylglycine-generating enzyme required for sulfatase activity